MIVWINGGVGAGKTTLTLVNPDYRAEIFDALRAADVPLLHVFLDLPADTLRKRIADPSGLAVIVKRRVVMLSPSTAGAAPARRGSAG